MKYRAEIDGLRAIAVVPVILFHVGFEIFSGGYVGVDIFFVISGYLITMILIEDIENKRFDLVYFYERRARRILPALFFVMLICIPFAWLWMLPDPLENFGQSLVSTSLFSNNFLLKNNRNLKKSSQRRLEAIVYIKFVVKTNRNLKKSSQGKLETIDYQFLIKN